MSNRQNQKPESTIEEDPKCKSWCAGNIQEWSTKCDWGSCENCVECVTTDPAMERDRNLTSDTGEPMAVENTAGPKDNLNIFRMGDRNFDMTMTRDEWAQLIRSETGRAPTNAELAEFEAPDANGNGLIEQREFLRYTAMEASREANNGKDQEAMPIPPIPTRSSTTENFSEMIEDNFSLIRNELKDVNDEINYGLNRGFTTLREDISLIREKNPERYCGEGTSWNEVHKLCKRDTKGLPVNMIGNRGYCHVNERYDVDCKYESVSSTFKIVKTIDPGIYGIKHGGNWCAVGDDFKLTCNSNKKLDELDLNEKFEINSSISKGDQLIHVRSLKNENYCEAGINGFSCDYPSKDIRSRVKLENIETKDFFQNS